MDEIARLLGGAVAQAGGDQPLRPRAVDIIQAGSSKQLELRIEVPVEDMARLSDPVVDSGPGVPDALRERIFEPFFTTKEVGAGTGMGLAISYRIVERHRGRIEVSRSAEGGAAFTVHIPLNLAEFANAAA